MTPPLRNHTNNRLANSLPLSLPLRTNFPSASWLQFLGVQTEMKHRILTYIATFAILSELKRIVHYFLQCILDKFTLELISCALSAVTCGGITANSKKLLLVEY